MKPARIIIGAMRFKDRQSAIDTVRCAVDAGFNYIDTAPCYCYKSENENSERWVSEAINHPDYRDRVMVSAKCSPGNGGLGIGEFNRAKGFSIQTKEQLNTLFDQSLDRLGVDRFDYYHMWTTHTREQFNAAMKPGGWYDGVMERKNQWDHLGITTHADNRTIIEFLETDKFETVTLPLNVLNRSRIPAVEYCRTRGIPVIAMNPLAGGLCAAHPRLKELAIRYLMALQGVHLLIGFSSPEEVEYAGEIHDQCLKENDSIDDILAEVNQLIDASEPFCTSCGYCQPCPQNINVGACLSYYNALKYMGLDQARDSFQKKQFEDDLKLNNCIGCGECQSRCPNGLKVTEIIEDAKKLLYG
ncbi:MAG: hypothetical protein GF401_02940 [Chitinivibrionales bacterium]|nr:hypothetical protein [Chitinivibrionales bacterium]